MLKISLIFLAFIAFFVLTLKIVIIQMGRLTDKYIGEKHRAIEEIVNTGKVPKVWMGKLEKRISSVSKTQSQSEKVLKMKMQSKTIILKKIDHLVDYSKTSPFVQDKETKEILLNKLLEARRLWEEKDWEEIITSPE
jgi:hypothetical protein